MDQERGVPCHGNACLYIRVMAAAPSSADNPVAVLLDSLLQLNCEWIVTMDCMPHALFGGARVCSESAAPVTAGWWSGIGDNVFQSTMLWQPAFNRGVFGGQILALSMVCERVQRTAVARNPSVGVGSGVLGVCESISKPTQSPRRTATRSSGDCRLRLCIALYQYTVLVSALTAVMRATRLRVVVSSGMVHSLSHVCVCNCLVRALASEWRLFHCLIGECPGYCGVRLMSSCGALVVRWRRHEPSTTCTSPFSPCTAPSS